MAETITGKGFYIFFKTLEIIKMTKTWFTRQQKSLYFYFRNGDDR